MSYLDDLKAIRERCEKATEGPWRNQSFHHHHEVHRMFVISEPGRNTVRPVLQQIECGLCEYGEPEPGAIMNYDLDFIAAARTDMPRLLDFVERLIRHVEATPKIVNGQPSGVYSSGVVFPETIQRLWDESSE